MAFGKKLGNKQSFSDIFFCFIVFLFFAVGAFTFIRTEKTASTTENRPLNQFEHFTISNFIEGEFQENFENAISDQFPYSSGIRDFYGSTITKMPTFNIDSLVCSNRYVIVSINRGIFDCSDYLVFYPNSVATGYFYENVKKYNKANKLNDVYYYVVNSSSVFDFSTNELSLDYPTMLKSNLRGRYHVSSLKYKNFEEFKKYFYKSDHHWSYEGSYQGYLDIAKMMDIKETITANDTFTGPEPFLGSHARSIQSDAYYDDFTVHIFDIPEHDTYINGEKKNYSHIQEFINHDYTYSKYMNFYGEIYGADYGEVVFDFHQPSKGNLLIFADSHSNAINELIAQHFNKTFVVDSRHFEREKGVKFEYSKYIKENKIDKTLIIGNNDFYANEALNMGLDL